MMPAATHFDPVIGVDVHMIQPPGPVPPLPIPHPYIGIVIDYADYAPIIGSTIKVNGLHRAIAGTSGKALPKHIPIGGVFVPDLPASEHEDFMGSATVEFDGDAATYLALPCLSCQSIGTPPIPRLNPKKGTKLTTLVLPTSVVLPIPKGPPVLIGGPPTISLMSLAMHLIGPLVKALGKTKVGQAIGHFVAKKKAAAKDAWKNAFKWMPDGFIKCNILKAEPIDIRTGEVIVQQQDFDLPGRIPIRWSRRYGSNSTRVGVCGRGWDTQADARLELQPDGSVLFLDGEGVGALFDTLPHAGPVQEPIDAWLLDRAERHYTVRKKSGLTYYFPVPAGDWREALVEALVDSCRNSLHFVRGPEGLEQVVESAGRRLEIVSQNGLVRRIVLHHPDFPQQRMLVRFAYDREGELTAVYDALDHPYTFGYSAEDHAHGRLNRHTNRTGLSFYYEYDEDGRCVHGWGDGGLYDYHFEYDPIKRWTNYTDSLGHPWSVEIDERGQIVRETDPLGGMTSYAYDEVGRTTAVVDPLGHTTAYEFDERGNLLRQTMSDGAIMQTTFDSQNNPMEQIDAAGHVTRFAWDDRGLLLRRILPRGGVYTYEPTAPGDLGAITDPNGARTSFEVDRYGNPARIRDPAGHVRTFRQDAIGRIVLYVDPAGAITEYGYDAKGRIMWLSDARGGRQEFAHDAEDRMVAFRDARQAELRLYYAGLGELVKRRYPDGSTMHCRYDTEERLVEVVNERGEHLHIERDPAGRIARIIDYWGGVTVFDRNIAGQVIRKLDQLGRSIAFELDDAGRTTARRLSTGGEENIFYDLVGRIVAAHTTAIKIQREFDADGNLVREWQNDQWSAAQYDLAGNRTSRWTSWEHRLDFAVAPTGRVATVRLDGQEAIHVRYEPRGMADRLSFTGGVLVERSFDPVGQLAEQRVSRATTPLHTGRFIHDAAGLQTERHLHGRHVEQAMTIRYDRRGRVTSWDDEDNRGACDWSREASLLQERTIGEHATPIASRMFAYGDRSYRFDLAGNLIERCSPAGLARFEWDALNRLTAAVVEDGAHVELRYDPLGRRLDKRSTSGSESSFLWHGEELVGEWCSNARRGREFITLPGTFAPIALVDQGIQAIIADEIGLPLELLAETGETLWAARTDGLGRVAVAAGAPNAMPMRFPGQHADTELGMHYNRYRYFDPVIVQFVSRDPIGLLGGHDLYRYADNPWTWMDPFGLNCSSDAAKLRANMVAAGRVEPPYPNSAHHMVLSNSTDPRMAATRQHLTNHGIDINDANNGVFLPTSTAVRDANNLAPMPPHSTLHTNDYKQAIHDRITPLSSPAAIQSELSNIRNEIVAGTFPF